MKVRAELIWVMFAVSAAILVGCAPEVGEALLGESADKADTIARQALGSVAGNANDNGVLNGNDNGVLNGNDNGALNGNDNGTLNGNDNGALNGNDNGALNGNDNGAINGNDNGGGCSGCPDFDGDGLVGQSDLGTLLAVYGGPPSDPCVDLNGDGVVDQSDLGALLALFGQTCNGNGNDNGTNGNDNGAVNGNDNGTNGNDNGAINGNDNGSGGGECPDGSQQVFAQLSGDTSNEARYRELVAGCRHFRARVRDLAPFTTYQVIVEGLVVGSLTTDEDGRGELEYNDGGFPPGFPTILSGDVITIGPVSGVFFLDCSNGNCNG